MLFGLIHKFFRNTLIENEVSVSIKNLAVFMKKLTYLFTTTQTVNNLTES